MRSNGTLDPRRWTKTSNQQEPVSPSLFDVASEPDHIEQLFDEPFEDDGSEKPRRRRGVNRNVRRTSA